jgi:CRP/FNR family cyclic AMP-dependent transcriptional regulator
VIEQTNRIEQIAARMRELLRRDEANSRIVRVARNEAVYEYGERDENVYLVESGIIRGLLRLSRRRECFIDVYTRGEIFGEMSLCGQAGRIDAAVALEDSTVKQISSRVFLGMLRRESLLEDLVQYLAALLAEQQQVIARLLRASNERRLARLLLHLGRKLGKKDPRSLRVEQKFSHSELATMTATTRPQVCTFLMRFRQRGLIDWTAEQHLIVKEHAISDFLLTRKALQ